MSEREFNAIITETDIELLAMLLHRYAKTCRKNAKMALSNGYGSCISFDKADSWQAKAAEAESLTSKLAENAN